MASRPKDFPRALESALYVARKEQHEALARSDAAAIYAWGNVLLALELAARAYPSQQARVV